ncbi:hypothetical protein LCGC14_0508860 [marine sediment metagenome]|uniref:RmlD-like substrate binding domain-containing protein n=1 Tax=marine sediment metagenome TaxID=412755 RepID=A0A0F9SKD2_9ZZZZ
MKIGVTGPNGRLGSELIKRGCVPLEMRIDDREAVRDALERESIDVLINCAAYTAVDDAEKEAEKDALFSSNHRGVGILRQEFLGFFIHISTGYVFNGEKGNYSENDKPDPLNEYGWSKFGGEQAANIRNPTCVVRTLDLFGHGSRIDFVRAVREMLALNKPIEMPKNLYGNPTYIPSLADALLQLATKKSRIGLLHIAGESILSRYEFARLIAKKFDYDHNLILATNKIKGAAPRPRNAGLSIELAKSLGLPILKVEEALEEYHSQERAVHEPLNPRV